MDGGMSLADYLCEGLSVRISPMRIFAMRMGLLLMGTLLILGRSSLIGLMRVLGL